MENFINTFFYFIIYSFLGWVCETVYCSLYDKKFVNRGLVHGPFCTIYGFGALGVIYLISPFTNSVIGVFLLGMTLTSLIEYVSSYMLEMVFDTSWWDYSNEKFNLNGRICLKNSILFGIMAVLLHFYIHVYISAAVVEMNQNLKLNICICFAVLFTIDYLSTVLAILQLNNKLSRIHNIRMKFLENAQYAKFNFEKESLTNWLNKIDIHEEIVSNIRGILGNIKNSELRILNAFPKIKNKKYNVSYENLKKYLKK